MTDDPIYRRCVPISHSNCGSSREQALTIVETILLEAWASCRPVVALDLQHVSYCGARLAGILAEWHYRLLREGRQLLLENIQPAVGAVLNSCCLTALLTH